MLALYAVWTQGPVTICIGVNTNCNTVRWFCAHRRWGRRGVTFLVAGGGEERGMSAKLTRDERWSEEESARVRGFFFNLFIRIKWSAGGARLG